MARASNWTENAEQAEQRASNQAHGTDALLLILIDEIRALRGEVEPALKYLAGDKFEQDIRRALGRNV